MPAKKIICPICDASVLLGKPAKSGNYFCPSCHGEIVLQRSKRKVRERRSGVMVGGEVYGVKAPSETVTEDLRFQPAVQENAPRQEPGSFPQDDFDEDLEVDAEAYEDEEEEDDFEEQVATKPRPGRSRTSSSRRDEDESDEDDGRSPRHSRTTRSAARTAVVLVLLVLAALVSAGVIWLKGFFGDTDGVVADTGPRLQIPVAGVADEESGQIPSRSAEVREVDVDRLIESRRSEDSRGIPGAPIGRPTAGTTEPGSPTGSAATTRPSESGPSQTEIEGAAEVARAFLESRSAEERGRMIRNRETDLPLMLDFYQKKPRELEAGGNVVRTVTSQNDYPLIGFMVMFPNGRERFIGVEVVDGGFKVDWPSFAIYHDSEWSDFVGSRITNPTTMRVYASPVDYYNFAYDDSEVYYCLRLEDGREPYANEPIYGYIRRDHEDFEKIVELAEIAGQFAMPLVLELKYPLLPQTGDQVEIVELISNGWMIRD